MPKEVDVTNPWPRLRHVVSAAVTGLHDGRFIEETLEALCVQLGAASAWSTLETKGRGPLHRSRSAGFRGVPPAVLALHVEEVLDQVKSQPKTIAGAVPYAGEGSFVGAPLWSRPKGSAKGRALVGALYLEFASNQGSQPGVVEFVEAAGVLLGGMIAQQTLIETTKEDLRVERATSHPQQLTFDELVAPKSMRSIGEELRAAMSGDAAIFFLGESGTGKTQLATAFAQASGREPVVRATLGMADDLNTITSELFGHERGAFSGAVSQRKGLVEYADGGSLILDEVLNLPGHAQQLLLDFTQFGWYRPLGFRERDPKTARVRLLSVTNGDLEQAIREKRFRHDLYYRLATVPIVLPPLRERRWEIPEIALGYLNRTGGRWEWELGDDAIDALTSADLLWPGNIRELEAVLERARNRARAGSSDSPVIRAEHLDLGTTREVLDAAEKPSSPASQFAPTVDAAHEEIRERWSQIVDRQKDVDAFERRVIQEALAASEGIVSRAARLLGVPRTGLISRMTKLDVDPDDFRSRPR